MLSLALVLAGWSVCLLGGPALSLVGGVVAGLAGVLLAVVGLLGLRDSQQRRGTSLAVGALILAAGLFGLQGVRIFRAIAERVALPGLAQGEQTDAPGRLSFETHNFSFSPPATPWRRIDHAQFHPRAVLGYARGEPAIVFLLVAETPGVEQALTTQSIMTSAEALRGSQAAGQILDQHLHRIGGLEGVRWFTEATLAGRRLSYVQWGYARNGFTYQLLVWGERAQAAELRQASEMLFERFALLDASRVAHIAAGPRSRDVASARFSYRMRLDGTPWAVQADPAAGNAAADLFARYQQRAALVVMPIDLHGLDPSLELLGETLLGLLGMPASRWSGDGSTRALARTHRGRDGQLYHYRIRLSKQAGMAYMLVGWSRDASAVGLIEAALSRFEPVPRTGARRALTPRELLAHTRVFNGIGTRHFAAGRHLQAVRWLRKAFEFQRTDPVVLANLIGVFRKLGKRGEARYYLRRHIGRFPGNPTLRALLKSLERRD